MNSHISRTSTFCAPVVQSRLEHHHQQMLKQSEARQQQQPQPQRSKSLNNKGKRSFSYNHYQKIKETTTSTSTTIITESTNYSRNSNKNFSNNFDSSYHREQNVGYNNFNNNNFLVENGSISQSQRKTSSKPSRRHQHSDSVDEDKLRVVPTVSILKRPKSATDFVKSSNSNVSREEQSSNNINHRSNKVEEKFPLPKQRSQSKERRRSDVTPSRSKRVLRKEVKSMEIKTDLMLPIQLSGSGDEPDVNSDKYNKSVSSPYHNNNNNAATTTTTTIPHKNNAFTFPPLNYSNVFIALEEGMNSNKKEDTSSNSDDNATIKSSLKKLSDHYIESTPRRRSSTAIELQSQVSRFAELGSESFLSSISSTRRLPPSSSSSKIGGAPKLYAGPTFHNSPAPSDLPMPSFYGKSLGKEPSPLSVGSNNLFTVPENVLSPPSIVNSNYYDAYSSPSSGNTSDDDIFSMDEETIPTLRKQKSQELLRILSNRPHQSAAAYMVPERMATAHNPMQVYPSNDLNEISETLRNLLKIHGQ